MIDAPPVTDDAQALLEDNGVKCLRVIHVDTDSILYVNTEYKPRTAWLTRNPSTGLVTIKVEAGFPAEPS